MSVINLNQPPYYDDYDSSKNYISLLAVPGRVAQAREFTQMQSTMRNIIKSIGDSLMKDGDVIEGCQVSVATDKKSAIVSAGKVYMDGMILPVVETTVAITGVGQENIGVIINDEIITSDIDPVTGRDMLKDPALGYDNYNMAGCHRLKRTLQVVVNNDNAAILSTLVDGDLQLETYAPEYNTLTQTLARRTYDESGSYIVRGLKVSITDGSDSDHYTVEVDAGKAYVLGYEIGIAKPRKIEVLRSTEYAPVFVDSYFYVAGTQDYKLDDDLYVKEINQVIGTLTQTDTDVRTNVGTQEDRLLTKQSVIQITKVAKGTTVYTQGTDYELVRDGTKYYLRWKSTASSTPAQGEQYNITYTYKYTFTNGTDYTLLASNGAHYLHWTLSGQFPNNNTNFSVSYDQYLARKDLVSLDNQGNILITQGIPAEYGFEVSPEPNLDTLPLAIVMSPPNGSASSTSESQKLTVDNVGLTRFTMQDIHEMLNRIRTLEYDNAVLSLNNDAESTYVENEKRGILTDPFVDLSRCDLTYNLDTDGNRINASQPIFKAAIDVELNLAYLPVAEKFVDATYKPSTTTASINGRLATLGKTGEVVILNQPSATRSYLVNPYSMYPGLPTISIDPAVDFWIDETIIEVPVSLTNSQIVSTSTSTIRSSKRVTTRYFKGSYYKTSSSSTLSEIGTSTESYTEDNIISEEAITYCRQRTINVSGEDFPANLDNIKGYIDDQQVQLTPTGSTKSGTEAGTIMSNSSGRFDCSFTIPSGIKTGDREVRLQSDIIIDGWGNSASTIYQASGISRTIERTVTTVTTVLLHKSTTVKKVRYYDPVGQTFIVSEKSLLSAVDLYFEAKPSNNASIIVEVRGVTNGTVNDVIYADCTLHADDVNISSNATAATRFTFDSNPALLEADTQYAIVCRSESDEFRIWVAEMGDTDIVTGEIVKRNPYMSGVFLSSSNNAAWTIHQMTDLKLKLYRYTYASSGIVDFNPLTVESTTMLTLMADQLVPVDTEIKWYYSLDGSNYILSDLGTMINLGSPATTVYMRAEMTRSNTAQLTPMIALDTVGVLASKFETSGDYIFKNVPNLDEFDEVRVVVEQYVPAGTSLKFYCSIDNGENWLEIPVDTEITPIVRSDGWYEYQYALRVSTTATRYTQVRMRVYFETTSTSITPAIRRFRSIVTESVQ